jgi:hypothetical protein
VANTSLTASDPGLARELLEADRLAARQSVISGEYEINRVVEQVSAVETRQQVTPTRTLGIFEYHREVGFASLQRRHRVLRLALGEHELDLGVALPVEGNGLGDECRAGAWEARDPDSPTAQPGERGELTLRVRESSQNGLRVRHEHFAGIGQAHAPGTALEEGHPGFALERRDLLADRGLGERKRIGGGGERTVLCYRLEHPKALDVEHKTILSC